MSCLSSAHRQKPESSPVKSGLVLSSKELALQLAGGDFLGEGGDELLSLSLLQFLFPKSGHTLGTVLKNRED